VLKQPALEMWVGMLAGMQNIAHLKKNERSISLAMSIIKLYIRHLICKTN
jgi:hypothetical protein